MVHYFVIHFLVVCIWGGLYIKSVHKQKLSVVATNKKISFAASLATPLHNGEITLSLHNIIFKARKPDNSGQVACFASNHHTCSLLFGADVFMMFNMMYD